MDRQCYIRQQLELLSSPTSIHYHRTENYSSIVESVRRVRKILAGDDPTDNDRFIRACCRNDLDAVRWLLDNQEFDSIDFKRGINRLALHEAVLQRQSQPLVRLLCQYGADPKQRDSLGRTPIHYAASYGHLPVMIDLLEYSRVSSSTLVDIEGRCPLMYACGEGHLDICQWLVEHERADYQRCDDRGRSPLTYASRSGHLKIVEWLLTLVSPSPTHSGWYPLHFACASGHIDVMKILLVYDKDFGQVLTKTGHSALFLAMNSTENCFAMVKYLLDWHPTIQLTDKDLEDLNCKSRLILLLVQRRHSLKYLVDLIKRSDQPLLLLQILLISEHRYSSRAELENLPEHRPMIEYYQRNPLTLKQMTRCFIRKFTGTSEQIDRLIEYEHLRKYLHFESLF